LERDPDLVGPGGRCEWMSPGCLSTSRHRMRPATAACLASPASSAAGSAAAENADLSCVEPGYSRPLEGRRFRSPLFSCNVILLRPCCYAASWAPNLARGAMLVTRSGSATLCPHLPRLRPGPAPGFVMACAGAPSPISAGGSGQDRPDQTTMDTCRTHAETGFDGT